MTIDILIVDDEADIRHLLASVLQDQGYTTRQAKNSQEALQRIHYKKPGIVVLDVWLNNSALDGIQILEEIKKIYPDVPVIIISGHGTVDMAVSATKKGAYDFIAKPFKTDALLNVVARAIDTITLKSKNIQLRTKLGVGEFTLIGECKEIVSIRKKITELCGVNVPVLIIGQAGTGKDIVANILHEKSARSGYYVVFNAIYADKDVERQLFGSVQPRTSGVLEEASAGSLLIDNIDALPTAQQLKLAKSMGAGNFIPVGGKKPISLNTRIIAICRDGGALHPDLSVRFHNATLTMPTLDTRISDVKILAESFMHYRAKAKGCKPLKFSGEAITVLSAHKWRGNMWEFINVIDRIFLFNTGDMIGAHVVKAALTLQKNNDDIPMENILMHPMRKAREQFEQYYLSFHIKRFNGNVTQMAKFVEMDRAALSRKMKGLHVAEK